MPLQLWNRSLFFGKVYLISNTLGANQEQCQDIEWIYISDRGEDDWFHRKYLKNWRSFQVSSAQPWAHTDLQDVIQGKKKHKPKLQLSTCTFSFSKDFFLVLTHSLFFTLRSANRYSSIFWILLCFFHREIQECLSLQRLSKIST